MNRQVSVASSQRVVFTDENVPKNIEASENTNEVAQDPNEVVSIMIHHVMTRAL